MSRILRRPMFRGGRVDSRGTGITSGLSYQKGGRVGYFNGGSIYDNIAPYYTPKVNTSPGWSFQGALQGIYDALNPTPETVLERSQKANPPDFGPGSTEPFIKTRDWEKRKGAWEQAEAEKAEATKQAEIDAAVAAAKAQAEAAAAARGSSDIPEETDAEKIARYKEMFQEAYGSGRGDDISNMLLNFAGKALKPEATTKTAFGEFFEEEAKRPSESKKYKDASTTAAINAFLTGEKSMADLDRALKINRATLQDKIAYGNLASDLEGKDWDVALDIVQRDRYKGAKKRDSFLVVSEALKGKFKKPVDQKKGNLKDIDTEDLIEGFTILTTDTGKLIIEKIGDKIIKRTDLLI